MAGPTLVLISHSDPQGLVAPHVARLAAAFAAVAHEVVLVSGSALVPGATASLHGVATVLEHPAARHAVARWRHGLAAATCTGTGDLTGTGLHRLLLVDDRVVGPLRPLEESFAAGHGGMRGVVTCPGPFDRLDPHVVDLGRDVLASPEHDAFWLGVPDGTGRTGASPPGVDPGCPVAAAQVVALERWVRAAGLPVDTVYRPSAADRAHLLLQRCRRAGRTLLSSPHPVPKRRPSEPAGAWGRAALELRRPPDLSVDSWRSALDGRLPFVRLDVLGPDGAAGPAALAALEERHPRAFSGVGEYLHRTQVVPRHRLKGKR